MRDLLFFSTLAKSLDFDGRASRREYWVFMGISTLIGLVCLAIDISNDWYDPEDFLGPVCTVLVVVIFIPSLAVSIRRLHDVDLSGWFYLLNFIPVMGPLILLMINVASGSKGPNRFGPPPHGAALEPAPPPEAR